MKFTKEGIKWSQIHYSLQFMWENQAESDLYKFGSILEFGVGKGDSLKKICDYLYNNNMYYYGRTIMGFDSFEGLPDEAEGIPVNPKYVKGAYKYDLSTTDIYNKCNCKPELRLVKCMFDKIPDYWAKYVNQTSLIHIDCDLYNSTLSALTWCFQNKVIVPGTLVAFDEYRSTLVTDGDLGGEEKAWHEIVTKYNIKFEYIYQSKYLDKDTEIWITQTVVKILDWNGKS
jgi:hypothetical protein